MAIAPCYDDLIIPTCPSTYRIVGCRCLIGARVQTNDRRARCLKPALIKISISVQYARIWLLATHADDMVARCGGGCWPFNFPTLAWLGLAWPLGLTADRPDIPYQSSWLPSSNSELYPMTFLIFHCRGRQV